MNSQDDYEILPQSEVEHLRKEVEKLRSSPSGHIQVDQRLTNAIENLNTSIHKLESVFDSVRKDILKDFENNEKPEDLLKELITQNKQIAKVLLRVVEKVDGLENNDKKTQEGESKPEPELKPPSLDDNFSQKKNFFDEDKQKLNDKFNETKEPDIPKPVKKEDKKGFLGMFKK